jgi:hypothetical protein
MRRYILAVHILVILSIFSFMPVLAAPVAVQEVREARADVADGGEDVVIVLGKRAEEGQDPLTQASPGQSKSVQLSTPGPGSQSTSDDVSGVHETTNPIQPPSSALGEMRRPLYASGGTELSCYSSDDTEPHLLTPGHSGVQQVQPGTTSKLPPSSSVGTETHPWVPNPNSEIGPATPSESESESESELPAENSPASASKVPPNSPEWETWDEEKHLAAAAQIQANQPPPPPKTVLGKLAVKSKSLFSKLGRISKELLSEMVDNPHLQIRISASGAVNAAQREQDKVHTETYVSTSFLSYKYSDLMVFLSVTL